MGGQGLIVWKSDHACGACQQPLSMESPFSACSYQCTLSIWCEWGLVQRLQTFSDFCSFLMLKGRNTSPEHINQNNQFHTRRRHFHRSGGVTDLSTLTVQCLSKSMRISGLWPSTWKTCSWVLTIANSRIESEQRKRTVTSHCCSLQRDWAKWLKISFTWMHFTRLYVKLTHVLVSPL